MGDATSIVWDSGQRAIIEAAADASLLVEAGPGTGKTHVACGRIAYLISTGIEPANVLFVSFTRTAVAELRQRIAALSKTEIRAQAVRITTLDSAVWQLRYGFSQDEVKSLFGSYEANLQDIADRLTRGDLPLLEFLERIEHLVVDEAQDLVGIRAELVRQLIRRLSPTAGVTVYADSAQSIYGFTTEEGSREASSGKTLPVLLQTEPPREFSHLVLKKIHRTDAKSLLRIFEEVREVVLSKKTTGADRLAEVNRRIDELADGRVESVDRIAAERMPHLILYRRRFDVLMASSFLSAAGVRHRLRMGGMPSGVFPWVGATLAEHTDPTIDREQFTRRWNGLPNDALRAGWNLDAAWNVLLRFAGDAAGRVDILKLRRILGRARPPVEFCAPDCGDEGPILGTIHASKGREAGNVALYLPRSDGPPSEKSEAELDEESRVLFVGATRARAKLLIGQAYSPWPSSVDGRVYRLDVRKGQPKAQVEIGREHDLILFSCVGTASTEAAARAHQQRIAALAGRLCPLFALADPEKSFRYGLYPEAEQNLPPIASLNDGINRDLFQIAEKISAKLGRALRPPMKIPHLYVVGVRTVVLPEDDPYVGRLPRPYSVTGMLLAPMIKGLPALYFANRR